MSEEFNKCVRNGGSVRRIDGPNTTYGLKEGEYVEICTRAGESFKSDIRKKDSLASLQTEGLVSMKLDKKERKAEEATLKPPNGPEFPWGLHLRLETEALDKLGINLDKFKVGGEAYIICKVYVKEKDIEEGERVDGEKRLRKCLGLQITHMKIIEEEK